MLAKKVLSALLLLALAGCTSPAPTRPLVASGHPDWPPVMYVDNGQIDGVGPALAKLIFADLGITATFPETGAWDVVQTKARSGEVDVLVAAYKTTARLDYMVYCDTYITDPVVLFVKQGHDFAFAKNEDLIGKKGVGTVGDSYGQKFDDFIKANLQLQRVAGGKEGFDLVENGQADYFIYSLYAGHEELKTAKREGFSTLPHYVAEEPFYLAISKQSPYLKYQADINRLIQKYVADGTVAKLIAKYKAQFHLDQ